MKIRDGEYEQNLTLRQENLTLPLESLTLPLEGYPAAALVMEWSPEGFPAELAVTLATICMFCACFLGRRNIKQRLILSTPQSSTSLNSRSRNNALLVH